MLSKLFFFFYEKKHFTTKSNDSKNISIIHVEWDEEEYN